MLRIVKVVIVQVSDVLSRRHFDSSVRSTATPRLGVRCEADILNVQSAFKIRENVGNILAAIIDHHNFAVLPCLLSNRLKGATEHRWPIERAHDDGDSWATHGVES
jgi:hypothetical protein